MATTWKAPTWRMPNEKNQSKFENYSLEFSGINQRITTTSVDNLQNSTAVSVSAWVKTNTNGNQYDVIVLAFNGTATRYGLEMGSSGKAALVVRTTSAPRLESTTVISDNTWKHIVGTWDGTNTKIYINGVLENTGSLTGTIPSVTSLDIGRASNGYNFEGSISDASIFNYALSESQVSSLYNSGSPINPMTLKPVPIAYYPLGANISTGGVSNTLSIPNVSVPDASVFDFTGASGEYISTNSTSLLNGENEASFSFWVKAKSGVANYDGLICQRSSGGAYLLIHIGDISGSDYRIYIQQNNGGTYTMTYTPRNLVIDTWYQVCIKGSVGGKWDIYTNNSLNNDAQTANNIAAIVQDSALKIGQDTSGRDLVGEMSNVQIWNKNLSTADITTLYNNGVPLLTGTQPEEANLKAWYKLDQSANWETDAAGKWQIPNAVSSYPQSFNFLSTDNDVLCIDTTVETGPINSISQSITVSAWCKTTATTVYKYLVNRNRTTSAVFSNPWTLTKDNFYGGGGRMIWSVQNTNGDTIQVRLTGTNDPAGNPLITMNDGKWHHIVGVYDSSTNTCSLYTDGVLQGTATTAGFSDYPLPTAYPASRACVGGYNSGSLIPTYLNGGWDGEISNVQIWDKAFTNGNVTTLFNNGVPLTTNIETANLKGSFKLDNTERFDGSIWSIENKAYPAGFDSALNFTAVDSDYIGLGTDSSLDIFGGNFSVSLWFKHSNSSGAARSMIEIAGFSDKMALSLGFTSNTGVGFAVGSNWYTNAGTGFNDGEWHHMVATRTGTTYKIYIDSQEITASIPSGSWGYNTTASPYNRIGTGGPGGTKDFNGELSNIAIFNTTLDSAAVTTLYNNGTPETSISSSPISWWKLNNTTTGIQDSVGSNNGTNNGTTKVNTFVSTEAGISKGMTEQNLVNNNVSTLNGESSGMTSANLVTSTLTRQVPYNSYSAKFDGLDYFYTANNAPTLTTQVSLSAWVKRDGAASGYNGICGARDGGSAPHYGISYDMNFSASGNKVLFRVSDGSAAYVDVESNDAIPDATWTHIAGIYDGANVFIYINGVKQTDTETFSGTLKTPTQAFTIGAQSTSYPTLYTFNGFISNVSIFNKGLTSTEVLKLYNSGVPGDLSSFNPSPTAWWSLGSDSYFDGNNWIAPDLVGTNNCTSSGMDANALIGNAPNSTGNGTSANMSIDANLIGSAPNSSNNSFSVNMSYDDRVSGTGNVPE